MSQVKKGKRMKNKFLDGPSKETDELIMKVNANPEKYGWKANECMLTKTHPKYDAGKCSSKKQSLI